MNLIKLLKSNTFAIYIAIASVIVQSFHSFYAFYKISSLNGTGWGIAQAVLFALIVDCAVLFYTVRKNTKVTWMAAFVMVLINLYVYFIHLGLTFDFILGVLISFVIPVSNYFYSEEITDEIADVEYEDNGHILALENERNKYRDMAEESERFTRSEQLKATKYITELREEIKAKDALLELHINHKPEPKGFASLRSPAQEEQPPADKSLLGVDKIIATDRPNPPLQ